MVLSKPPEILAPVGNWEMCRAAVHNGADAVYLGLPGFNARGRAELFDTNTLKEMIEFCHLYGVKVFIASNVLLFEREITEIQSLLYEVIPLNPDAFIVQDIGLVRLIHQICAEQIIHASTQMTVTNYEAIELTADLQLQRYVLGRECSIAEVEKIRAKTDKELEVFVHGALCVSYSGQCLTSESFGGRSANRGQCAQSCRLDYELIVDGVKKDLGEKRFLVSPKDLCAIEDVGRLVEIGIDSFKIEGRLKSPQYVAETVRQYKAKVIHPMNGGSQPNTDKLALTYSRGFFNGWMDGVNHQSLVDGRFSNHHGLEVGKVCSASRRGVVIQTSHEIQQGEGIVFADFEQKREFGASVYEVFDFNQGSVELRFSSDFEISNLKPGMSVFVNASPSLAKQLERSWTVREEMRKIPINIKVTGEVDSPLVSEWSDSHGNSVTVLSNSKLEASKSSKLTTESLEIGLCSLGATTFKAVNISNELKGDLYIHNRELKEMRRSAVDLLTQKRKQRESNSLRSPEVVAKWISSCSHLENQNPGASLLNVLVRSKDQIKGLSDLRIDTVYLDFEFGKEYSEAVSEVRELGFKAGIATTRILKPGELGHLKVIERLKPDSVLVRNLGALHFFKDSELSLVGDFSLNITNSLSADWFLSKGLQVLCPSYDLNAEQLLDLLSKVNGNRFEVTIHQYMPTFHMEHCVYAAFLSTGTSFRDCGKPCEQHRVELRDHTGALHPLKADAECRNTLFNGVAQSGARFIPKLKERGVKAFRVEALYETSKELRKKVEIYEKLVHHPEGGRPLMTSLGATERFGVTEGQLFNITIYKDRRKGSFGSVN